MEQTEFIASWLVMQACCPVRLAARGAGADTGRYCCRYCCMAPSGSAHTCIPEQLMSWKQGDYTVGLLTDGLMEVHVTSATRSEQGTDRDSRALARNASSALQSVNAVKRGSLAR